MSTALKPVAEVLFGSEQSNGESQRILYWMILFTRLRLLLFLFFLYIFNLSFYSPTAGCQYLPNTFRRYGRHLAFDKGKPGVDITFCLGLVLLHQNRTNKLVHVVLWR